MYFEKTPVAGAYLIIPDKKQDERGFFARLFCSKSFAEKGLPKQFVQVNNSLSQDPHTLRGLHYQLPPHEECKLLRCIRGSFYDVILDLRPSSPSYRQCFTTTLSAKNRHMVLVPEGCAHGFLTLEPNTESLYFVSAAYAPDFERGVRWNDPSFAIQWPAEPQHLSDKDRSHPDWLKPGLCPISHPG